MKKNKDKPLATQVGLHSIRNMLGDQNQLSLFSQQDHAFSEEYGLRLSGTIDRFGVDLTDVEARLVEGILRGFSDTFYQGNLEPIEKDQLAEEKYSGKLPSSYKYLHQIPRLRATQSQILQWANINQKSIAAWARAVEAIQQIGAKQYCFYYDRLALDEDNKPTRDNNGRWKKEEVMVVDTLFTIKEVREGGSSNLQYYEITPSAIFLDQRESYFMLIPYNWREEVKSLVGNKKASSYTFRFLLFLRYQYELRRRSPKQTTPYQIQWSPEEISIAIKMPESIYHRKKARMHTILEDAYAVAMQLGYLTAIERKDDIHILTLNDNKYFNSRDFSIRDTVNEIAGTHTFNQNALLLFDFFHSKYKKIDASHDIPTSQQREEQLRAFNSLLIQRSIEDIERMIDWSLTERYWCTRLSTPQKLCKNFAEAWLAFRAGHKPNPEDRIETHKNLAKRILTEIKGQSSSSIKIELLSKYVEIGNGVHQPSCISYEERQFQQKLEEALIKWGFILS